jgi:hypothetical protein
MKIKWRKIEHNTNMLFKSAKLTNYIIDKFKLVRNEDQVSQYGKDKIDLFLYTDLRKLINDMINRELSAKQIATMILNEDNPKTMDYFFMKLLKINIEHAAVGYDGSISGSLLSNRLRITQAFGILNRIRDFVRGQLYFVLDIHEGQIFPKSRLFRICSRKLLPINTKNPNAGKIKKITYGSGYVSEYIEPKEIMISKHLMLYCKNSWERKGEVKPSRAKNKKEVLESTSEDAVAPDAIAETVSVI